MPTLYSSVIKLVNLHHAAVPPPGGQHAHGAFFHIIEQVDPALSNALHEIEGKGARKPFTVSPLFGLPKNEVKPRIMPPGLDTASGNARPTRPSSQGHEIRLREGWECWLRVTMLDDALFRSFIEHFLAGSSRKMPQIRLGDAHFGVSEILTTPGSHPWAGYASLEDLQKRLDEPAPAAITLELHSPVSFSLGSQEGLKGKQYELIPYPKLVFGNLATAWKALTGETMVEAVEKYAEKYWQPVLHRLERKSLPLHNHPQFGSVGRVEYRRVGDEDNPLTRALSLLADLAFYTGLGRKTAQGMGMSRRL